MSPYAPGASAPHRLRSQTTLAPQWSQFDGPLAIVQAYCQ